MYRDFDLNVRIKYFSFTLCGRDKKEKLRALFGRGKIW